MEMSTIKVRITFFEELLGTASANPDIHREYIASKAPDAKSLEEEVEAIGVDGVAEKAKAVNGTARQKHGFAVHSKAMERPGTAQQRKGWEVRHWAMALR